MQRADPSHVSRNGGVSFWYAGIGLPEPRPALDRDRSAEVCIAGAGFTGLWAAYYLKRARPDLEVVILEREFAGFGASGRNGGWLSSLYPVPRAAIARTHGRAAVEALDREMRGTVDEVLDVCAREGIDADAVKRGILRVARNPAQAARLRARFEDDLRWGLGPDDIRWLDADELAARVRVVGALGATFTPHAARVQPAKLVQGLAGAVERLGVRIYEQTAVTELAPGEARTDRGTVRARFVLRCLEGFTSSLAGLRREWLPLNSAIVATAPLPDGAWSEIGWQGEELLGDAAHAYIYAQRTADGRIALGGRGVPYRLGSRTDRRGETQRQTVRQLTAELRERFPALQQVPIEHAWCGVLGVARDWAPAIGLDRGTGLGFAGGYVGDGVATTNLAGRTLRDLVLGENTELTALPWVGHSSRKWEPEPLRWLGARLVYGLYRAADRREAATTGAGTHPLARLASAIAGR